MSPILSPLSNSCRTCRIGIKKATEMVAKIKKGTGLEVSADVFSERFVIDKPSEFLSQECA